MSKLLTKIVIGSLLGVSLVSGGIEVAFSAPVPDFAIPGASTHTLTPVTPQVPGQSPPLVPVKFPSQGNVGANVDPFAQIPGATPEAAPAPKTDESGGVVGVFTGITKDERVFMDKAVSLRQRVILDTLQKRADDLEGIARLKKREKAEASPKVFERPVITAPTPPPPPPLKVLGIHADRVLVSYQGDTSWITLGGNIGPFYLQRVTDTTATFKAKDGTILDIKKEPKVIPRPQITVISVEGQTATINYRGDTYTVTLNSPIGDLTVTALTSDNFSVTDSHGRLFTYPVPLAAVAKTPSSPGFGGFPPPPQMGGGFNNPGQSVGQAEDSNF